MTVASTAPATWGISGPAFLGLYFGAGAAVAAFVVTVARSRARAVTAPIPAERFSAVQLGLLAGRERLGVTVALAELRQLRLLGVTGAPSQPFDESGRLLLTKPLSLLDPVTRAVHRVIADIDSRRGFRLTPQLLARRPDVASALASERRRLQDAGLATCPPRPATVRLTIALIGVFVVLGVARTVVGLSTADITLAAKRPALATEIRQGMILTSPSLRSF